MKMPGWIATGPIRKGTNGLEIEVRVRWWHPGAWIALIIALFAGCATTTTPPPPTETQIPIGVPCLTADKVPVRPDFVTDAQLAAKPDGQLVFALGSDRLARQDYEGRLEATISGCVGKAPVPAGIAVPAPAQDKPWWRFW